MSILQPRQPLPRIINLNYPRVGVLPQVEEFPLANSGFTDYYSNPIFLRSSTYLGSELKSLK